MKQIAIIGGGAAGCFCAVEIKRLCPDAEVTVYEAGPVLMAKLALTGGGKCNLTNSFETVRSLKEVYPRGARLMERLFYQFSPKDTVSWWENEGVSLFVRDEGRVFPKSLDAMQVVGKLRELMHSLGVKVVCHCRVDDVFSIAADVRIIATGGGNAGFLQGLGVETVDPVPSLFSFRIDDALLRSLSGLSVRNALLGLEGTSFKSSGALLVTDWGLSGPAVLKLSSYAARHLADNQYKGRLAVNWCGCNENGAGELVASLLDSQKLLSSVHPESLPSRLWQLLLKRSGLRDDMRCSELGTKGKARLVSTLTADCFPIAGKTRFKDEFVTCGGVALSSVRQDTLEAKTLPGLYFAGEALDIDAVTGGFNLQAAWTTAIVVARAVADGSRLIS